MAEIIADWRAWMGAGPFDALWQEVTGQPVPEWLAQAELTPGPSPERRGKQQGMTAEQFITLALTAVREKKIERIKDEG